MRVTCVLTVASDSTSCAATSALDSPAAIASRTSPSRSVSYDMIGCTAGVASPPDRGNDDA
jgi:hypothetical protein